MKTKLLAHISFLFIIYINAQIGFENHLIDHNLSSPYVVLSADFDGDGDMDILVGENANGLDGIFWYKNTNGLGDFAPQQRIESVIGSVTSMYTADIDNDGDIDILSSSWRDNKIVWYENLDGLGRFSEQRLIISNGFGGGGITADDIDGDGDLDVAVTYDSTISWFENVDGLGNFTFKQSKSTLAGAFSVILHDMDKDGDNDILFSTNSQVVSNEISWLENTNGLGNFSVEHSVASITSAIFSLQIADIDGDGNTDIISAFPLANKVVWYKNIDGLGTYGAEQIISTEFKKPRSIFASDIDNDGDIDIFSGSYENDYAAEWQNEYKLVWHENTDGLGDFSSNTISATSPGTDSVFATDIDKDGDIDLFATGRDYNNIYWYENTDGNGSFENSYSINLGGGGGGGGISVFTFNINNDNYKDVLYASASRIVWYKNKNGSGEFVDQTVIATDPDNGITSIYGSDLDNDGDIDIISALQFKDQIAWYENIDGLGNFGSEQPITTNANGVQSLHASDIDGDGDMDIVSASQNDDKIAWYENIDGLGNFGSEQPITTNADLAKSVYTADLDNDADIDIISASNADSKIAWYENTNGKGIFSSEKIISTNTGLFSSISLYAVDLDNNGYVDILATFTRENKIAWYNNISGSGTFIENIISTNDYFSTTSIHSSDLDNDGDMDVIITSKPDGIDFLDSRVAWFENIDGSGSFGSEQIIEKEFALSVHSTDIDNDGDKDLATIGRELSWHENLGVVQNEINGSTTLDTNENGCDPLDLPISNLMVITNDGTNNLATFTNINGFYQFFTSTGIYTTSISGLPNYFTVSPVNSYDSDFTDIGNFDSKNDFCISKNQTINDINISILPISQASPGFDARYQLVYYNVGSTQLNGSIELEFDNSKLSFLTSSETTASQTTNSLTFNYSSLNPFETRTIDLNFNVLAPTATNIGDILSFIATINPISGDNTENDNVFELNQTVIGSFDPNDIVVLEGDQILIEDADEYLHYIIRFQNTGTASAINVKVNNLLDSNLDWATLQLESSSHTNRVEIVNGNVVSFIFDGIYLPDSTTDEPNSHGFIAYKIKPKSDVVVGDILPNKADIFFDFNPAIETNMVTTEITSALGVDESLISKFYVYPNPTTGSLNINSKSHITKLEVYNNVGQLVLSEFNNNSIDASTLSTGLYFIKIEDENGALETKKFVKK